MGNRVLIELTVFVQVPSGDKNYGVRVCDDYGGFYNDGWEEADLDKDPIEIVKKVIATCNSSEIADAMMTFSRENEGYVYVGDAIVEWKDVK
jgi:hypothetical protein